MTEPKSETIEFRQVTSAHLEQTIDLWMPIFPGSSKELWRDYAENELCMIFGAIEGDQVHSALGVHRFETNFGGKWIPCAGLAVVATSPAMRGRKLSSRLLTLCLKTLHEQGFPLVTLGTSIHPYYERLGWAVCDWDHRVEVATKDLKQLVLDQKVIGRYELDPDVDFARVMSIYDIWREKFSLMMKRDEQRWRAILLPFLGNFQIYHHKTGYIILDLSRAGEDRKATIFEWAYLDDDAYQAGLMLFTDLASDYDSVSWYDADRERIFKTVPSNIPKVRTNAGHMARVVNLESFTKILPVPLGDIPLSDPACVTCGASASGLSPGQLIQLLTGFWDNNPADWPAHLNGIIKPKTYVAEYY
jgi:predicted acetyltransferase